MTIYLTVAEVAGVQHAMVGKFGGSHGLRDLGALESTLVCPRIIPDQAGLGGA